ncbi:hypothetical protein LZ30DRAFT_802692 [Colletotrichum cereale]|nr:hypothetical protein LZ30DRAFT_802692 [Colletotrichum cereale]
MLLFVRETEVEIMRMRTMQTNVCYSVQTIRLGSRGSKDKIIEAVRRVLDVKLKEYVWLAKIIVYCRTVEGTRLLAE